MLWPYCPVRMVARAGQQMGVGEKALLKVRPRSASSSFVRGIASQYGVVVASRSSTRNITTFGLAAGWSAPGGAGGGVGGPAGGCPGATQAAASISMATATDARMGRRRWIVVNRFVRIAASYWISVQ